MSELELVLECIRAAKRSNEASLEALNAVEKLLSPPDACKHENTVEVTTMTGTSLVCDCGVVITK